MAGMTKAEMSDLLGFTEEDFEVIPHTGIRFNYNQVLRYITDNGYKANNLVTVTSLDGLDGILKSDLAMSKRCHKAGVTYKGYNGKSYLYNYHDLMFSLMLDELNTLKLSNNKVRLRKVFADYLGLSCEVEYSIYNIEDIIKDRHISEVDRYTAQDIIRIYDTKMSKVCELFKKGIFTNSLQKYKPTGELLFYKEEVDNYFNTLNRADSEFKTLCKIKSLVYTRDYSDYIPITTLSLLTSKSIDEIKTYPSLEVLTAKGVDVRYYFDSSVTLSSTPNICIPSKSYLPYNKCISYKDMFKKVRLYDILLEHIIPYYVDTNSTTIYCKTNDLDKLENMYNKAIKSKSRYITLHDLSVEYNTTEVKMKSRLDVYNLRYEFNLAHGSYVYSKEKVHHFLDVVHSSLLSARVVAQELGITVKSLATYTEAGYINSSGSMYLPEDVEKYKKKYGVLRSDYKSVGVIASKFNIPCAELTKMIKDGILCYSAHTPCGGYYFSDKDVSELSLRY